jgi:UDP-2-acetamido-3-amino-2,3-dideoxy-glucuronate N-acetyltransferase
VIADDVELEPSARIFQPDLVNLYGCRIGADTRIGPFVEIQSGAVVGARCKVQSHSFICEGVTIEDEVFIGHGVMFVNDSDPRATNDVGELLGPDDWKLQPTLVRRRASIGSGAVVMCGITIGEGALIGAGAVVTSDVEPNAVVAGVPARFMRSRS